MSGIRVRSEWHGDRIIAKLVPAKRRIIRDAAADWLIRSQAIVPLLEGHLQRSGRVEQDGEGASIVYPLVYARYQHERLDLRHAPGRFAKYITRSYTPEDFKVGLVAAFKAFFSRAKA